MVFMGLLAIPWYQLTMEDISEMEMILVTFRLVA